MNKAEDYVLKTKRNG